MADTYDYSLIRVVPDSRRGEWVNVGLCVYLQGRLDVFMHRNMAKLRVLAPGLDLGFLEELPALWQTLTEHLESAADRQKMLARMPLAHASPLGCFVVRESYEAEVESIMRDLIVPPPAPVQRIREPRLVSELKRKFVAARLFSDDAADINRHRVVQNYPIEADAGLYADFALRNGALRITETIDFRVKRETLRGAKHGQAAIKAITLNKAKKLDRKCVPSVVYAGSADAMELIQPSLNLLAGYAERLYDANNKADMAAYFSMMHQAAGTSLN